MESCGLRLTLWQSRQVGSQQRRSSWESKGNSPPPLGVPSQDGLTFQWLGILKSIFEAMDGRDPRNQSPWIGKSLNRPSWDDPPSNALKEVVSSPGGGPLRFP